MSRKSRETYLDASGEAFSRRYLYSEFGGAWPDFTLSERRGLVERLESMADFTGLTVQAYAVTRKALHLIVDEPNQPTITDDEMFRRFEGTGTMLFEKERPLLEKGDSIAWEKLRKRFGDVGSFMKTVKQVSTQHYHRERGTSGSLWQSRFASSFLQVGQPSRFVATWIAFANVREGNCRQPEKDEASFYGNAVSGSQWARGMVGNLFEPEGETWRNFRRAFEDFASGEPESPLTKPEKSKAAPYLTRAEALRCDIEAIRAGMAVGDKDYVEAFFAKNRHGFGPKRKSGARRIVGQNDPSLWTARLKTDLRKQ